MLIDRLKLEVLPVTTSTRKPPLRFAGYEVYPVVKERRRDGRIFRHTCRALKDAFTFIEASSHVAHRRPCESFEIVWSLYGRRREHGLELIADRPDQEAVFDLLYSMTGIQGISEKNAYRLPLGTSVIDKTAVLTRLKAAIDAIENYKDTEEMDSLALAEEAIDEAETLVEAGSKAAQSNRARPVAVREPRRSVERGNYHARPETQR
jgi:hypothetical protein